MKFVKNAPVGIGAVYDADDPRLRAVVKIPCAYVDKKGVVRHKTARVTEAERWVIESIAMRLFLDHKKVLHKEKTPEGKVKLTGYITIEAKG